MDAVRRINAEVEAEHGASAVWVAVSHGDIIKAVLADALGMHLDLFQRLQVDPASISVVRYTADRPYVLAQNTHAGDLAWLRPKEGEEVPTEAVPGGGAGPGGHEQGAAERPDPVEVLEELPDGPADVAGLGRS